MLDYQALITEAQQLTGLTDFGSDEFIEPLRVQVNSINQEARLSEMGTANAQQGLVQYLANRLRIEHCFNRHPEIAEEEIYRPVFVVGLFRSGTTKLHRLLCTDERWNFLRTWQTLFPAPLNPLDGTVHSTEDDDARRALCQGYIDQLRDFAPGVLKAHPMSVEGAEEEILLLDHTFRSYNFKQYTPSHAHWLAEQNDEPTYRYLYRMLQLVQWLQKQADPKAVTTGDGQLKRFVFKCPAHLGHLDTLLKVFPGAQVLLTHREPLSSVPSTCLLQESLCQLSTDNLDKKKLGALVLEYASSSTNRTLQQRSQIAAGSVLDVRFEDIVGDPVAVLPAIYDFVGEPLDQAALAQLQQANAESGKHKSKGHDYTLQEYGLSEDSVNTAFADYKTWLNQL